MQEGQLSLLVGEGRATYRPVNSSVSYQTAGTHQSARGQYGGQYDGQYDGQSGRTSHTRPHDSSGVCLLQLP